MMNDETIEIQVKVPVCITLKMQMSEAEEMTKEQLCELVDVVLEDFSGRGHTYVPNGIEARMAPHWDVLPPDECELTDTYEGLFEEE